MAEGIAIQVNSPQARETLVQSVKASLRTARSHATRWRRTDRLLFVTGLVSPGAATLVAALVAVAGATEVFPNVLPIDDGSWKFACALVAVLGFIATVCSALHERFEDRLAQGNECVGRLMALNLALMTGHLSWEETSREYGEIMKAYPEIVG